MAGGSFDLKRQREALEQLRREVEALDGAAECGTFRGAAPDSTESSAGSRARANVAPFKAEAAAARVDDHLEASICELEGQVAAMNSESEAARVELCQREAIQSQAKADWSRVLSHAQATESREERKLTTARREAEEFHSEELHQEAAHRLDHDRLRQRQRNLRMRLTQAHRQCVEAEQEDVMGNEFNEAEDRKGYFRAADLEPSPTASSTAVPRNRQPTASSTAHRAAHCHSAGSGSEPRGRGASKVLTLQRELEAAQENVLQLRRRQQALLDGRHELAGREDELRKASRISNREVQNLRRRSELRAEEAELRQEQSDLRSELHEIGSEVQAAQREAARQRGAQERLAGELGEREAQFNEQEASAMQALGTIDEFLTSHGSNLSSEERWTHLADWLEADISTRQVERIKRRLSEVVADAGARAQVLEQAVAELHADLDRRAAIILELVERRAACAQPSDLDGDEGDVGYGSSSDEEGVAGDLPGGDQDAAKKASKGGSDSSPSRASAAAAQAELDRRALGDELEHQRGLFELRGEQVQGLEQRLAALLAREAPRVYALRSWVAVHEALSREKLQSCLVTAAGQNGLRADVEAMQRDKSVSLAEGAAEWSAQRYHLSELANDARQRSDAAAGHAAMVLRRRQGLLRNLDQMLKAETRLSTRVTSACDAVDRDQRRLVDLTARQIRASTALNRQRDHPGEKVDRAQRGEAARQALQDARDLVEATRVQQAEALLGLLHEGDLVGQELKRVGEAMERETIKEDNARLEYSEARERFGGYPAAGPAERTAARSAERTAARRTSSADSPRRRPSPTVPGAAAASPRQTPLPCKGVGLERKRGKLEEELEATAELLWKGDARYEEAEMSQRALGQKTEVRVEEMQQELESERAKQRTQVAGVLKRYRSAQASCAELARSHGDLCTRSDGLQKELSDARSALRRSHEKRQKRQQQTERQKASSIGASLLGPSGSLDTRSAQQESRGGTAGTTTGAEQVPKISLPSSTTKAPTTRSGSVPTRTIPSILEIRQRIDTEGHPELHAFYLRVFPLLKGTTVEVFRRSSKKFETRQLVLCSDLQRLEIWTSSGASASSTAATPAMISARSRPRLAESFIRVEGLKRVHVPRATLAAVQRAILSATVGTDGLPNSGTQAGSRDDAAAKSRDDAQASTISLDLFSPEVSAAMNEWSQGARSRVPEAASVDGIGGSQAGSRPRQSGIPAGTGTRQAFPFELVMGSAETWRLMVNDVHTFHVATQAIGALVISRASLPAYAVALNLGGVSQQSQA